MKKSKEYTLKNPAYFLDNAPKSFIALETIQAHSALGKRLYNWAKDTNLVFKEEKMVFLGLGGPDITCNSNNSMSTNIGIIAHELMHCVQFKTHNHHSYRLDQDARSRIINGRGLEAGAVACQLRILYEMKLNNYPKPWNNLINNQVLYKTNKGELFRLHEIYTQIAEPFENTFKQSKNNGKPLDVAMKDACTAAHHAYFKSRALSDTYNKVYLKQMIKDTISGSLDLFIPNPEIDIKTIKSMTEIHKNEFLINDDIRISLNDKELFGNNDLMRQAFDYIETIRLERRKGSDNYGVIKATKELENDNNPYLDIDLIDIITTLKTKGETRNILEIMNDMAGIGNAQQLSLDFYAVANNNTPRTQRQVNKFKRRALKGR